MVVLIENVTVKIVGQPEFADESEADIKIFTEGSILKRLDREMDTMLICFKQDGLLYPLSERHFVPDSVNLEQIDCVRFTQVNGSKRRTLQIRFETNDKKNEFVKFLIRWICRHATFGIRSGSSRSKL